MKAKNTYPKFRFSASWVNYSNTLHEENGRFLQAVVRYGLYEEEPAGLSETAQEYFNGIVRPALDRQHARMRKGTEV